MERKKLRKGKKDKIRKDKIKKKKNSFIVKTVHATFLIVVNKRQPVNQKIRIVSFFPSFLPGQKFFKNKIEKSFFPSVLPKHHDIHPTI
jgi:hypothetical protein